MSALRLIAGLGNPGPRFEGTRHNVGAAFVEALARRYRIPLKEEARFKGLVGRGDVLGRDVRLLVPTTYMNLSGDSVGALATFFKIEPAEILVAYDEVAFEPGIVRLKHDGGDNGHNGIRSVVQGLGNRKGFLRLRIGVGHPGHADLVTPYLTGTRMPAEERDTIARATDLPESILADVLNGELSRAMNALHAPPPDVEGADDDSAEHDG